MIHRSIGPVHSEEWNRIALVMRPVSQEILIDKITKHWSNYTRTALIESIDRLLVRDGEYIRPLSLDEIERFLLGITNPEHFSAVRPLRCIAVSELLAEAADSSPNANLRQLSSDFRKAAKALRRSTTLQCGRDGFLRLRDLIGRASC